MPTKKRSAPDSQNQSLGVSKSLRSHNTSPHGSPSADPSPQLPTESPSKPSSTSASRSNQAYSLQIQYDPIPSQSRSRSKISGSNPLSVTTENPQQKVIRHLLRSELNGAVSHQPNFADALLPCPDEYLEQILRRCNGLDLERNKWSQSPPTGSENNFYGPTVDVLNAIGLAVYSVTPDSSGYVEFRARNSRPLGSHYPGMDTYPDIIRCQRPDAPDDVHWQDIDMFVEVKKDNSRRLVTESIEQSARYARALFAHRIDRRFIRTLVVCGKTAVFLHFDRSGLIYSDDVDIYEDPRGFVRAFAGLLLLKGSDAGYNPIFTNIWRPLDPQNPNAPRLDYTVKVNGEEYKVVDVLCIRKSVRGRATLVLALQRLERAEGDNTIDAVLKLIWRDQSRFAEGVILKEFIGVYGVCQVMYEADAMIGGVADVVYSRSGLCAGPRGNVFGPETASVEIKGAKADDCRVHSMLLMQPGRPLSQAGSPFELLAGMIGALMGHWALVNKQVQHRDISANNILLALNDYEYKQPEWEKLKEGKLEELAREFKVPKWDEIFKNAMDEQYEKAKKLTWEFDPKRRLKFLERVIDDLGPKPFGFLSDVDLANILALSRRNAKDMHTHRTGTLSFMATQLLLAKPKARIAHTYLHDLESFFWVLLYTVAEYREGGAELNEDASAALSKLERIDPSTLGEAKYLLLGQIVSGNLNVESFDTAWSKALAPVIVEFAKWTHRMVFENPNSTVVDPDLHFETILTIFLNAANDIRPEPGLGETQTTHVCSSTGECGASCPLRDTRREGEEPKISRSSKGSSDLP